MSLSGPLSEVLLPRPSTQLVRRESYRVSGFRWHAALT